MPDSKVADYLRKFAEYPQQMGEYWSNSNAAFEQGNPSQLQRTWRMINPGTALGSGIGMMQDAASQGDLLGMGLSGASSIPLFGATRSIKLVHPGDFLQFTKQISNWGKFGKNAAENIAINTIADSYDSNK